MNQPYSCDEWGNVASTGIPLITDDTGLPMFGMFHTDNLLPSSVFIDHTMTVYHKAAGFEGESIVNDMIQDMLNNLYGAPIISSNSIVIMDNEIDNDGVLNPGEGFSINYSFENNSFETDAFNVSIALSIDDGGVIEGDSIIYLGDVLIGEVKNVDFSILLNDNVDFGDYNIYLMLTAEYINNSGGISIYNKDVQSNVNISLNQSGFPIYTSDIRSSPLVVDLDNDGDNEIIIGDNNGFVHIFNVDGTEVENSTFPFNTGNQIWGSAASADMDRDGNIDFVISSKSKHLYIFDKDGLKTDYNADKYLMGTPAIGNLDNDDELEVVIGGYSSPSSTSPIFAINADGSNVDGFPLIVGEKTKAGIALMDFNNNGKDDMVFGTDDDNIYLIYDNGEVAPGFPYVSNDKLQAEPTIIDVDGEKIIFIGSNDNNLYAINSDGSLKFKIETQDKVQSSPSVLDYNNEIYIVFGSNDNFIYIVDFNGNMLPGWPVLVNGSIGGSVVSSDLNNNGEPEIIAVTDMGEIIALHLDGTSVSYFPIINNFPSSSSPMVIDLDGDNDLEVIGGSGGNLFVIDIKDFGTSDNYWNLYKGNVERNGCRFYISNDGECSVDMGDLTGDGDINILDLVQLSYYILDFSVPSFVCASDFNGDNSINILDLVQISNFILDN